MCECEPGDLEGIKHCTTKVRSPWTNGFVERMNRTLLDECFRVDGRKTWYLEPAEIQRDLDRYLLRHNFKRSHQGYRVRGRTPAQALLDGIANAGARALNSAPIALPAEAALAA